MFEDNQKLKDNLTKAANPELSYSTAFLISVGIIVGALRNYNEMFYGKSPIIIAIFFFISLGMMNSFIGIINRFRKNTFQNVVIAYYITLVTCLVGIGSAIYQIVLLFDKSSNIFYILFPLINIYYLLFVGNHVLHRTWWGLSAEMEKTKSSRSEIAVGSLSILIIFILCNNYFNMHWTVALSVVMLYIYGLHPFVKKAFIHEY